MDSATTTKTNSNNLPAYIASAVPNPSEKRAPWYKNTAPTYAGIFLWFIFWDSMAGNGLATGGLGASLIGVVLGALICYFIYWFPAMFGQKTGLPLYVVGTSTFGTVGGFIMPGLLMGVLQFGWLAVNAFGVAMALSKAFGIDGLFIPLCIIWTVVAAFVGLKGIQYVAKVATYLPLIPLVVLLVGLVLFGGHAAHYNPVAPVSAGDGVTGNVSHAGWNAMLGMIGAIIGFFATAGAAGVDFGTNSRDKRDVSMGGVIGIILAIVFTAGISVIVVAGARTCGIETSTMTDALSNKMSPGVFKLVMIGLTVAAFPSACFSSLIAANSFKTVMPKVNPFISVGIGAFISIVLAVTHWAGQLGSVFGLIGASFGPICGAIVVDYILSRGKWTGPRAGWNPAGWIAWAVGFVVGILPNSLLPEAVRVNIPCAPLAAFIVGAVVYFVCAKMSLLSAVVPMPTTKK